MDIEYVNEATETIPAAGVYQIQIKNSATLNQVQTVGDGGFMKVNAGKVRMRI